jgi:hypothetical protein
MKKTNESMLDVISYGGYSNQLTADYYPNNQVYNQLISELLKCKSGALLAYDDNNIFNIDKALTIKIEDIRVDNNIPISNVIYYCEEARIKSEGLIKCNLSNNTYIKQYFLQSCLCCGIDKNGRYMLITKNKRVLDSIAINRIKDNTETEMYYSDNCWCYRLFRRQDGFYIEKVKINLADYYICPQICMNLFIGTIQHQADNNILIVTYTDRDGNECKICGTSSEEWYSRTSQISGRYIHNTTTNGAKIRLANIKTGKISVIPLHKFVGYYVYNKL